MGKWGERVGKACRFCWGTFSALPSDTRVYCSRDCADWSRRSICECQWCGEEYTPKRGDRDTACSRECGFAVQTFNKRRPRRWKRLFALETRAVCCVCFRHHDGSGKTCSRACRAFWTKTKSLQRYYQQERPKRIASHDVRCKCEECGETFHPEYGDTRRTYCSDTCSSRSLNRRARRRCGPTHRKRARHYGVDYEYINRAKVARRDGWRCGICGRPISKKARYPDTQSVSLDHIIPLSRGGPHTYDNVQVAHWGCNVAKGDGAEGSQLQVFGREVA